jgi:hypothetical protein
MRWLTFFIWSSMSPSACIDGEDLAHVTSDAPKKRKHVQNKVEKGTAPGLRQGQIPLGAEGSPEWKALR